MSMTAALKQSLSLFADILISVLLCMCTAHNLIKINEVIKMMKIRRMKGFDSNRIRKTNKTKYWYIFTERSKVVSVGTPEKFDIRMMKRQATCWLESVNHYFRIVIQRDLLKTPFSDKATLSLFAIVYIPPFVLFLRLYFAQNIST